MPLRGVSVLVAGGGLAGLAAARDLVAAGADVKVIEARDRIGGRVWTIRDGFVDGQHAEAGGDLIDHAHFEVRRLAGALGLTLRPILRAGWSHVRTGPGGRPRIVRPRPGRGWDGLNRALMAQVDRYALAERRWDSPIAAALGRRSVASWLDDCQADAERRTTAAGLRGFFLADLDELSLLALVDQFATSNSVAGRRMYRIEGGNDRLPAALAAALGERVLLEVELVAVGHRGRTVRASVRHRGRESQINADYLLITLPATLLRRIPVTPALPSRQRTAVGSLKYGRATRTLLQFSNRFWRAAGRPRAFGTPLSIGAAWEGNEEQSGRPGILSLLAGGSASDATRDLVLRDGFHALAHSLDWLGAKRAELLASYQVTWEAEPWSRGGYAFIDPHFEPPLRDWLPRPFGRLFFAGEHTSIAWQGYMNGAIESGRRAAAEVVAVHANPDLMRAIRP